MSKAQRALCELATIVLLLSACSAKKDLDRTTGRLVKAAIDNDYAALRQICRADVLRTFPEPMLEHLSAALGELGKFRERTMVGIELNTSKARGANYLLSFERGPVKLAVKKKDGVLVHFVFSGRMLRLALKRLEAKGFGKLRLGAVRFLDDKGKARRGRRYRPGDAIAFELEVRGLTVREGRAHVALALMMVNSVGKVVVDKPAYLQKRVRLAARQAPVTVLEGKLDPQPAGDYKLDFTVTDIGGKKTVDHSVVLSIEENEAGAK